MFADYGEDGLKMRKVSCRTGKVIDARREGQRDTIQASGWLQTGNLREICANPVSTAIQG